MFKGGWPRQAELCALDGEPEAGATALTVEQVEVLLDWEAKLRRVRLYLTAFFTAFPDADATEAVADMVEIGTETAAALRSDLGL